MSDTPDIITPDVATPPPAVPEYVPTGDLFADRLAQYTQEQSAKNEPAAVVPDPNAATPPPAAEKTVVATEAAKTEKTEKTEDFNPDRFISQEIEKRSGGKAKTFEEWEKQVVAEKSPKVNPALSEFERFLDGTDGDPDKVVELYRLAKTDVSKMSTEETIRTGLRLENPNKPEEWIRQKMEFDFEPLPNIKDIEAKINTLDPVNDADDITDLRREIREIERSAFKRSEILDGFRDKIEDFKKTIQLPDPAERKAQQAEQARIAAEEDSKLQAEFTTGVKTAAQGLNQLKFKVGNDEFLYSITDKEKPNVDNAIQSALQNAYTPYRTVSADGKVAFDYPKFVQDQYKLQNFDSIMAAVADKYRNAGTTELINTMVNASTPGNNGGANHQVELTPAQIIEKQKQELRDEFLKRG